jgi:hypothetical protein
MTRSSVVRIAGALVGMAGGFAYYYYIGCASGSCPITGNPWVSTLYGGAIGLLVVPAIAEAKRR